jgi:predicted O-methyltransferase YrrM
LNPTKNQKALSNKVKQFHEWLIKQTWLNIKIINIDDGIAICYK